MTDSKTPKSTNWWKTSIVFLLQLGLSYWIADWYGDKNPEWDWVKNAILVVGAIGAVVCFFLYRFLSKKLDQFQEKINSTASKDD